MAESGGSIVTGSDNEPLIDNQSQKTSQNFSIRIKALFAFIVLLSLGVMAFSIIYEKAAENDDVLPMKIRMLLPPQEPFLLKIGENRVLDVVFYSGNDDRNLDNYKSVNRREIKWEVSPSGVVEVDRYGTLTTIKAGDVKITVKSQHNDSVINTRTIKVVENYPDPVPQEVKIIDSDIKAQLNHVLQRKIMFFTQKQAINIQNLPQTIKDYILNPVEAVPKNEVKQGNTVWSITQYADGSKRSFVTRLNTDEPNDRDKTMYFMGNRYLPGKGFEVSCIEDDNSFGIWTANSLGEVSHIEMIPLSYKEKAYKMSKATEQFVMRHGLASDSSFDGEKWVPVISDNDGLWTSMYTVGELMRYASLKRLASSTIQEIAEARRSALKSLKAVLLIANVPCRNKTINARIRHYRNTRINEDQGAYLSKQFLMKNRTASTDSYPGSPADGIGLFGIQAGTKSNGTYHGGKKKYTNLPFKKADWSSDISKNTPATTKRSLKGFWARTFIIEPLDGKVSNQLYFKHNKDGTQTVLGNAGQLYDFSSSQQPILDLGQLQLPKILIEFLNIDGVHYKKSDLVYKGDTSTDEVVGHLFLYKVAFDVLQQNDQQEKELKQLVKSTLVSFCDMLTNNGYNLVDATGQGTKWGKIVRDFVISDFTLQDGPLKAIELLMSFKLCYYITGQEKWKRQYQFLINDPSHRYLDLISLFWKRWRYRAFNEDAVPQKKYYHLEEDIQYDEAEIIRHILHSFNFSDDQQAFLAFYLAFQLEDDPQYLKKYKEGIDSFWVLISRSENPLWYFMYQLSNPKQVNKDYYGNNILDVASWHLSRTNVDTKTTAAFIEGSRKDVLVEGQEGLCQCSLNPHKVVGQRKSQTDAVAVKREINSKIDPSYDPINIYEQKALPSDQRHIHKFNGGSLEDIFQSNPNVMQAATVYTLPYWLGVYHNMIDIE